MKTIHSKVSVLFQSVAFAVAAANVLDKAYADGVGHPEYHSPFTEETNPQLVAMNLAGLYAADTAANIISGAEGKTGDEDAYLAALKHLAEDELPDSVKYGVKNLANLAWRAGQPFRDIGTKPLNRITRDVNAQFNTLPPDEQDKDLIQIRAAAKLLLAELSK